MNTTVLDLAGELRQATAAMHHQVERGAFVARLIAGRLDGPSYLRWLRCLSTIYGALEDGLAQNPSDPVLSSIGGLPLRRGAALRDDIVYWQSKVTSSLPLPPAAASYADHLRSITAAEPALLLAHAYVRYLGDLSGGQLLSRAVSRMPQSDGGEGRAFYDFGSPETVGRLSTQLREALHSAGHAAAAAGCFDRLITEAVSAFERHAELFAQLAEEAA